MRSGFPQRVAFVGMARNSSGAVSCRSAVFLSGRGKLFVPERRDEMRKTLIEAHVPFPEFNAAFISAVEFICGLLLILGALERCRRAGSPGQDAGDTPATTGNYSASYSASSSADRTVRLGSSPFGNRHGRC